MYLSFSVITATSITLSHSFNFIHLTPNAVLHIGLTSFSSNLIAFQFFVAMKIKFDWKRILVFTIISAGLLYITRSALMSAGILLLLFVVYYLLVGRIEAYQQKKQREKEKDTHS